MRIAHRIGIAVVTAALAAASGICRAGAPPKQSGAAAPVNEGLLEFLGSVDPSSDSTQPDDGSWLQYLAQTNIGKVAKTSRTPQAPAQPKPASSTASGDKPGR